MKSSSENWKEKFGRRLRKIRKEKKLSLSRAAQDLHVHLNTLAKWERGESEPCAELLIKLSSYYNVPIGNLMDSNDGFLEDDPEFLTIYELYKCLPQMAQGHFLNIMRDDILEY